MRIQEIRGYHENIKEEMSKYTEAFQRITDVIEEKMRKEVRSKRGRRRSDRE